MNITLVDISDIVGTFTNRVISLNFSVIGNQVNLGTKSHNLFHDHNLNCETFDNSNAVSTLGISSPKLRHGGMLVSERLCNSEVCDM